MREGFVWETIPYTAPVKPTSNKDRGKIVHVGKMKALGHFVLAGMADDADVKIDSYAELKTFEDAMCDALLYTESENPVPWLAEWARVVKLGGHVVLLYPETLHVIDAMRAIPCGWDLREAQWMEEESAFLMVFRKRADGVFDETLFQREAEERKKHAKRVCIVRYGGFGDMLQAASILPALKRDGWHVTVMTEPKGHDIIGKDPHVDAWVIQANDQVPNAALASYWKHWSKKFDRFVNLSESIEVTLLATPGKINHTWPIQVRQKHLNLNYFEWTAELAGVKFKPGEGHFYPTDKERAWALAEKARLGGYVILFALAGSSVHKVYPHMDAVVAKAMLEMPRSKVVFVGDNDCKLLEQGWENEPRVIRASGCWGIRQTLAFAQVADCVLGPETGVLNAVAFEPNLKVCLLSHSSRENLTKNWFNTKAMEPKGQACYPCHLLHYSTEFCDIHPESGTAMCQWKIEPQRVYEPIEKHYRSWAALHPSLARAA